MVSSTVVNMFRVFALVSLLALCHGSGDVSNYPKGSRIPVPLKTSGTSGSRIVGGVLTTVEDHPYVVSLQHEWEEYEQDTIHFCTGVIISEDWILTAGQCASLFEYENVTARVGSTYFHEGGTVIQIVDVIVHPSFSAVDVDYDIALLRPNESLVLSSTVQPVGLPMPNQVHPTGTSFTIASWGASVFLGDMSLQLREVELPTISTELCKTVWFETITDQMYCAYEEYIGVCIGDTGAPAVVDGVLIGIHSWNYACSAWGYPSVYTNVSTVVEWVTEVTGVAGVDQDSGAPVITPLSSLLTAFIILSKITNM